MAHSVRHFLCPEFAFGQIFFYHSAYHVDVNGLNDIIVHSAFNKPLPNPRNCVRSESYNGCGAVYAVRAAYLRSCLFAVHHRHMAVHKYHIVLFLFCHILSSGSSEEDTSRCSSEELHPESCITENAHIKKANNFFMIDLQYKCNSRKKIMTHKATRVIMGVTTQPQTGGAICVITLILAQKSGSCQEF